MSETLLSDKGPFSGISLPADSAAVILAAGFSSRMSGFKPLLPLPLADGERHPLEALCTLYREAGAGRVLVVSGFRAEEVEAEARRLGVATVRNPQPEAGMFSSVCTGLAALPPVSGAFVHPVDIPLVRPLTLHQMARHIRALPPGTAQPLIPTCRGEEGHPPYIPSAVFPVILNWMGPEGLRGALRGLSPRAIPVADRFALFDMDTDAAYAEARLLASQQGILEPEEAETLLAQYETPERGLLHARSVGRLAAALAETLNRTRAPGTRTPTLSPKLALSGGLLHDICKGRPNHERTAGKLLRELGLPRMARLVEDHRDLVLPDAEPITERELVYLADKYVLCHAPVPLRQRFGQKLERFADDPAACAAICGRLAHAETLEARFRRETGAAPLALACAVLGSGCDHRHGGRT